MRVYALVVALLAIAVLARTAVTPAGAVAEVRAAPPDAYASGEAAVYLPAMFSGAVGGVRPTPWPTAAAAPARLVLNELLFAPSEGENQVVELLNTGGRDVPLSGITMNTAYSVTYTLPDSLAPLRAGETLCVHFDGRDQAADGVVHAPLTTLTRPDGDTVRLIAPGGELLDRASWGADAHDPIRLGAGGIVDPLKPGSSLGRLPGTSRTASADWARYGPDEASLCRANGQPAVDAFPMMDGLVSTEPQVELAWYAAPGADSYEVEVAREADFSTVLSRGTVRPATYTTPALAPGEYVWRVRAVDSAGTPSAFSAPLHLTVDPGMAVSSSPSESLSVPLIKQKKDTKMLLIDGPGAGWAIPQESGTHAWDVAHPDLDTSDPADNTNCGLATVAMISAYFGGQTSQDRLGFELFGGGGSEGDLKWGRDLNSFDVVHLMEFATGPGVVAYFALGSDGHGPPATDTERDAFWQSATAAIDNGQPVAVCGGGHCVAMYGYSAGLFGRRVHINDPWRGRVTLSAASIPLLMYAFPNPNATARSDEPAVSSDGDGDGVVDFDELLRFGTSPVSADSDGDEVRDKEEIRLSMFDPDHGYAYLGDARDSIDGDTDPPEIDRDSDDGGCADGLEDLDKDGKISGAGETSPFERGDDGCVSGYSRLYFNVITPHETGSTHLIHELDGTFSLKPDGSGGLAGSGSFSYHMEGEDFHVGGACDYGYWPRTGVEWSGPLTGTIDDGFVTIGSAPDSPPYTTSYVECGVIGTAEGTASWIGPNGQLEDGVYDTRFDYPVAPGTGEHYLLWHIEQPRQTGE